MAIVGLEGIRLRGHHGYYEEERRLGNEFLIDVQVSTPITQAAMSDDLSETVNYETLYLIVQSVMRQPAQLLESLAERIVGRIEEYYETAVNGVQVKVRKLAPPLGGEVAASFVEIRSGIFNREEMITSLFIKLVKEA